jgi:hypothetical protein
MKRLLVFFIVLFFANDWVSGQSEALGSFYDLGFDYGYHFITLIGSWTRSAVCGNRCFGADFLYTNSTTAELVLKFTGTNVVLYFMGKPSNDWISVDIYSFDETTLIYSCLIDADTVTDTYQMSYMCPEPSMSLPRNAYSYHLKRAQSEYAMGTYLNLDALMVVDNTSVIPTPTEITLYPTPTEFQMINDGATLYATVSADGIDQVVAFRYQVDAGQMMIVILLACVFFVLLVMLIANLRKRAPEP